MGVVQRSLPIYDGRMFHHRLVLSALVALVACGEPPPALTTLRPILDVRPVPIVAVSPALGMNSETPILLRSVGSASLEIRNLALEGPASLTLPERALPLVLAPLEETTVNLGFRPTSIDPIAANLVVYSNNTDDPEMRISITAGARTGKVLLVCASSTDGHVEESCGDRDVSFEMAEVGIGGRGSAHIRLRNVGTEPVTVSSLALDNNSAQGFGLAEGAVTFVIPPGLIYETMVHYKPQTEGRRSATLVVESDDGFVHRVGLLAAGGPRAVCLSPSQLDFGTLAVGAVATSTVEVEACGGRPVLVTAVEIGTGSTAFRLREPFRTAINLAAGARFKLPVIFSPTSTGAVEGALRVQADAGEGGVALHGASEACLVEVGPNLLTFAPGGGTQALTLRSQGTCAVVLERVEILPTSDPGFSVVSPMVPVAVTNGVIRVVLRYSGILSPSAARGTALLIYTAGGARQSVPLTLTVPDAIDHLQCVGTSNARWRVDWPTPPAPVSPAARLGRNSGSAALGNCPENSELLIGETAAVPPPGSPTTSLQSLSSHIGGKYYFEATQLVVEASHWAGPVVSAWPHSTGAGPGVRASYAAYVEHGSTPGVIGVAADFDAGRVHFYKDGVRVEQQDLLVLPGVGSYFVGAQIYGNEIYLFNLGNNPFVYQVPTGYLPWATGPVDENGYCARLGEYGTVPAPPVEYVPPDVVTSTLGLGIETRAQHPIQLVHLAYIGAGTSTTSHWALDGDGQPMQAARPAGFSGDSVLVEVSRPGRILLTMDASVRMEWVVVAGPATELVGAVAYGNEPPTVVAPGVTTQTFSATAGDVFPYEPRWGFWPGDTTFLDYLEATYCLPLKIAAAVPTDRVIVH